MDDNSEQQQSPQGPKVDRTFIEGAAGEGVARPETGAAAPPGRNGEGLLPPGDKPVPLGSGTVAGILGTGGMARIYKIWNEKLEVYRAVKVLLPSQRPELRDRFETEAKITAKLDHPNIVDILTVGEWNGLPYIEMEYIDGCSLDELIARRGRLPPAVCSAVGCCIARALRYAHGLEYLLYGKTYRGMIHRDLKPANIMISREGAVKLMDFGIARPEGASLHTVEGNVVGTLQYLSPEQMDGVEIDSRSDIYSFGAILYEMVTGTRTFPQQTITNLMKVKALNRYRSFKELGCQVAPSLAKISQRCLQSERSRRYESAGSLLADLEAAHARLGDRGPEETVRAYCSSPSSPEAQPASKRIALPLWVWPVSAATLACIGAGLWLWLTPAGTPGEEPAVSPPPVESPREAVADTAAAEQEEETEEEQGPPAVREKESPPPRRAAAPEPKRRPARTKPVRRAPSPPPAPAAPADPLKERYGVEEPMAIARKALDAGAPEDAVAALDRLNMSGNVSGKGPVTAYLLRVEALIKAGRLDEARKAGEKAGFIDAWLDYLRARIADRRGNTDRALELYQSSLTKPSVTRSRAAVRNESLYQTALIYDRHYQSAPSPTTRLQAINAWNNLKRCYQTTPDHPRFRKANERLASIR